MARTEPKQSNGVSLAKAPVAIIGLLGLLYGLSALIFGGHGFALSHVPTGAVHGKAWLGLEVNGWSDLLVIVAGLLLMFGAPLHWGAKGMSLIVGLVLGAAALIGLVRGNGVFGILAANGRTELVWGVAGVLLILVSLLPRVGAKTKREGLYEPADRPLPRQRTRRQPPTVSSRAARTPARVLDDSKDPSPSAGAQRSNHHESR
ncbi:MAG: hypothetical protein ACR2NR_11120 [Solirubrobacteraceae bacterium]